jgi:hypothetical protein
VKPVRYGLDRADVNVRWKLVVQFSAQRVGRQIRIQLEMRHLRERMHAGIGPARAIQLELAPLRHLANGAIDLSLDRPGVLLDLPSAVASPGVLDQELETGHESH